MPRLTDQQMAYLKPPHVPERIWFKSQAYFFDMVAPITQDLIYRTELPTGEVKYCLVIPAA